MKESAENEHWMNEGIASDKELRRVEALIDLRELIGELSTLHELAGGEFSGWCPICGQCEIFVTKTHFRCGKCSGGGERRVSAFFWYYFNMDDERGENVLNYIVRKMAGNEPFDLRKLLNTNRALARAEFAAKNRLR